MNPEASQAGNEDIFPNITGSTNSPQYPVHFPAGIPKSYVLKHIEDGQVGNFSIQPQLEIKPKNLIPTYPPTLNQQLATNAINSPQPSQSSPSTQELTQNKMSSLHHSNIKLKRIATKQTQAALNRQLTTLIGAKPKQQVSEQQSVVPNPNLIQNQPNVTQNQPNFMQNQPNFVQNQPNFIQNQPNFVQNQPNFMQNQPNFVQNQPNFIQNQPNFMQNQPNFMQNQPNFMNNPVFEPNYVNEVSFDSQLNPITVPISVNTNLYGQQQPSQEKQAYSPSDAYKDKSLEETQEELREGSESPDFAVSGQKRLSAFKRLGPLTETKKPKLTINLTLNKDEAVREVVDGTKQDSPKETYTPFELRPNVTTSTDDVVMKYLVHWPWKKNFSARKRVSARKSKTAMMLELEQMKEIYRKELAYFEIDVTGYPKTWTKEKVLDILLDALKGKSFIPCFIYFTETECKFLVIRSLSALTAIHKMNFVINYQDITLYMAISDLGLSVNHLDFLPRLILSKKITSGYDNDMKLSLQAFTLGEEISHFIYFPLHRQTNQVELINIQSIVAWDFLTELDLSHNKISSIDGFDLSQTCPRLKHLDLSYNCIEKITTILKIRSLALKSIKLEGNPICHNYIDPELYVKVLRMIFSGLKEIDGVEIQLQGELPKIARNYCPEECSQIVSKILETFFPLMDSPIEDRALMENLYDENATLTITYKYKLRFSSVFRYFRNIFLRSRALDENELDSINGAANIAKHYARWPMMQHDPYSFTVDVLWHNDTFLVLRINGILKLTAETLAEDEEILAFTRTFVLKTDNEVEYKIQNEMIYWENPTEECADNAFKINTLKFKRPTLKLDSAPDDDLKAKLTALFMKVTNLPELPSTRCLEHKEWNFKSALQLFYKLLKVDNLDFLTEGITA